MKIILFFTLTGLLVISANDQECWPPQLPCGANLRFAEHGDISWGDERARLDVLAIHFRKSSNQVIYFLIYAGLHSCKHEARLRALRARKYLVQHHKLPQASIVWKDGGFKPDFSMEIWLLPSGKPLPEPSSFLTVDPSQVRFSKNCKELKQRQW